MNSSKHLSVIFLTSCITIIGTVNETKAVLKRIQGANYFKRGTSSSTANLASSQLELSTISSSQGSNLNLNSTSTSSLNNPTSSNSNKIRNLFSCCFKGSSSTSDLSSSRKIEVSTISGSIVPDDLNLNSTSTSSTNTPKQSTKDKFKNLFSKSDESGKKEKPPYTVWDYIRGKPITTEDFTQTPSPTFRDVGIQCELLTPPTPSTKTQKSKFLGVFKKQNVKQTELSPQEQEQKVSAKLTTYSHVYRSLEKEQLENIALHQRALQKRLQEHLELLIPDSEQPSTSSSTSQNLQNAKVKLMERSVKIEELNEKVQDLKNIKTEIESIGTVLASIEPLKRETREEKLANETVIQGKTIQPSPKPSQPKKRLMKLKHTNK